MLQVRDEASFGFESSDEVSVVGELRAHHLDRHLTSDGGLERAIDVARGADADLVAQFVPADGQAVVRAAGRRRPGREPQAWVVVQDLSFELDEFGGRVETELLAEVRASVAEGAESIRLAAGPVEGKHQECREPFV